MAKYRKKPVVIEAVQWLGDNTSEILDFINHPDLFYPDHYSGENLVIRTMEGDMTANVNDFIIRGVAGELYPCKPDIFEKTYEAVDGQDNTD